MKQKVYYSIFSLFYARTFIVLSLSAGFKWVNHCLNMFFEYQRINLGIRGFLVVPY